MNKSSLLLKKITGIAVFSALAFVTALVFRLPVGFLTFDAKDAVITIAALVYGPISAPIMSLIVAFLEMITLSDTGPYGFIMNFASSATFSFTASLIYKYKRSFTGSIIGLYSAVVAVVGVMMLLNTFVTPFYMGVERSVVVEMLPTVLLPFNLAKALLNAAIVMLLYKPVIISLRRARLIERGTVNTSFNKSSVISIIVALTSIAVAIVIFVILPKYI